MSQLSRQFYLVQPYCYCYFCDIVLMFCISAGYAVNSFHSDFDGCADLFESPAKTKSVAVSHSIEPEITASPEKFMSVAFVELSVSERPSLLC